PFTTVFTVVVDGQLTQLITLDPSARTENLIIEGNFVDNDAEVEGYGISGGEARDVRIENNEIHRGQQGIHFSGPSTGLVTMPGTCSADNSRYCVSNADCAVPGVDSVPLGTCTLPPRIRPFAGVENGQILNNRLVGPFRQTAAFTIDTFTAVDAISLGTNAVNTLVEGNDISGSERAGIRLGQRAIETATIRRNLIHGNAYGILLLQRRLERATYFGATVTLNDIFNNRIHGIAGSVGAGIAYDLATEVSDPALLRGNYWGRPCSDSLGFREFDPADLTNSDTSRPKPHSRYRGTQLQHTCRRLSSSGRFGG
ncbi:MAG: right-handed parallel beta-helix repeat-containing protein, partial [Acidobacteria bacterium]|nr:right-handed parallel beta-helix repeat-containing protein [Acidobacteriota bacterium]